MSLDVRMKDYEHKSESKIPPYKSYILRLNGNNFRKLTKGFNKPYDFNFVKCIMNVMNNLIDKFLPTTGYCHSDEITLIFDKLCNKDEYKEECNNKLKHMHSGRINKICSLVASYCSVRFNYHIINQFTNINYKQDIIERINKLEACFDCRVLFFDDDMEIVNYMIWRSINDCYMNCVYHYAALYYNNDELEFVKCDKMIDMMRLKKFNFDTIPLFLKYGIYAKKELYDNNYSLRSRIKNFCFKISYNKENYELLLQKYYIDNNNNILEEVEL